MSELARIHAGVPRVGNVSGAAGVRHQKRNLSVRVTAADALHVPEILLIHPDQEIIFFIICPCHLPRGMTGTGNAMLGQLPPGRRVDGVSKLLPAGRRRFDVKLRRQSRILHQLLHNELRHRTAADVAVADEKYFYHNLYIPPEIS